MDDDTVWTGIFFFIIIGGLFAGTYFFVSTQPPPPAPLFLQPQIFADSNMRANAGDIWWSPEFFNVRYSRTVYAYNPNKYYGMNLDIYFEAFPQELTSYCHWSKDDLNTTLSPGELREVNLFLAMDENTFRGNSSYQGDVITRISGVRLP